MRATLIYKDWLDAVDGLTTEERGELFTIILRYVNGEDVTPQSPAVRGAWGFVRKSIDRGEEILEKKRAAGRAGGRRKQNEADESKTKQNEADESKRLNNTNTNTNTNSAVNTAPAREEVVEFFLNEKATVEQADRFFNYWEAAGWIRGSTPLKAWQPSARQWILEDYRKQSQQPKNQENGRNKGTTGVEIAAAEEYTDMF